MAITPGTRLGSFEIAALIGVGGMGEVYRATDTNLKRPIAIKVLRHAVSQEPDRLARFQREAEVLASLNHPNIAQIYGLEESDAGIALVMELVDGPTLADRIAQGRCPVKEVLLIAKQIAEALEAAHERASSIAISSRPTSSSAGRHGQSARLRSGEGDGAGRDERGRIAGGHDHRRWR